MNKLVRIIFAISMLAPCMRTYAISSLSRNDPYPVFDALNPDEFLLTHQKLELRDPDFAQKKKSNASIAFSPFGQNAERGRNIDGVKAQLGDLQGRWSMLALLYGKIPPGQTLAPTLQTALENLFPGVAPGDLDDGTKIDPNQEFGYFSVPLKYRKRGIRFDLEANMIGGFGLAFQTGVVCLSQTNTGFLNRTCDSSSGCPFDPTPLTKTSVNKYLMDNLKPIAQEINLDLCDFSQVSIEEVRLNLFWRKLFELNTDDDDWPHLMFIPYFQLSGSVSPGDNNDTNRQLFNLAFAAPFGNWGHSAIGFNTGLNFDFVESMEIGVDVGTTYFFSKDFDNYRLPTSCYQTGIFPYRTCVSVSPGINWHVGFKLAAYHFLDRLSGYFQYIQLEHKQDNIRLKKCEDEGFFLPEVLECRTGFGVKLANIALNYDVSPNINLGIFAQLPLGQTNAYRSTTVMFSFNATM